MPIPQKKKGEIVFCSFGSIIFEHRIVFYNLSHFQQKSNVVLIYCHLVDMVLPRSRDLNTLAASYNYRNSSSKCSAHIKCLHNAHCAITDYVLSIRITMVDVDFGTERSFLWCRHTLIPTFRILFAYKYVHTLYKHFSNNYKVGSVLILLSPIVKIFCSFTKNITIKTPQQIHN